MKNIYTLAGGRGVAACTVASELGGAGGGNRPPFSYTKKVRGWQILNIDCGEVSDQESGRV